MPGDTMTVFQDHMIDKRETARDTYEWASTAQHWREWYHVARDWLAYALEFSAVLRTNEPAWCTFGDLRRHIHIPGRWQLLIGATKTSQGAKGWAEFDEPAPYGISVLSALRGEDAALVAAGYDDWVTNGRAPMFGTLDDPMRPLASMAMITNKDNTYKN
jgi:hypothetical protein